MEFQELIKARRSVRKYASGIPHEDIAAILDDARMAPSWKNSQTYRCYVVDNPEILEKFRESALPPFNQKSAANAALIVTTFEKDIAGFTEGIAVNEAGNLWGAYDLGLHDAYLIMAASDRGYDTLIMGIRNADVIRETLGVPETEEIMSVIAVGKRSGEPVFRPRKDLVVQVRYF